MRAAAVVFALLLVGFSATQPLDVARRVAQVEQQAEQKKEQEELKIPPEEVARKNPVKPEAGSIAAGKKLYSSQCAMCHGPQGDGKGDLVEVMKLKLRDYRDREALKEFTDGALFYILNKGKGAMPGQEGRMTDAQKWNLINYLRSLARKEPAEQKPPS